MAVIRTVSVPLAREPAVLFGLRIRDTIWVLAGVIGIILIWHDVPLGSIAKLILMGMVGASAMGLALIRIEEATVPEWSLRFIKFWISARLFLP